MNEEAQKIIDEIDQEHEDKVMQRENLKSKKQEKQIKKNTNAETSQEDSQKVHKLDREIHIKVRPKTILKSMMWIVIFSLVFFAGRWSVDGINTTGLVTADNVVKETAAEEFSLSEFVNGASGTTANTNSETITTETNIVESTTENQLSGSTISEVNEAVTPVVEDKSNEAIVTTYNNVDVTIKKVLFDWKETWGKITKIEYKIINNEAGTIKPDHFTLLLEGYPDFEKVIPLPPGSTTVRSKTAIETVVDVPGGFAYNEITAGDLSSLLVTLVLYDNEGRVIDTIAETHNLIE